MIRLLAALLANALGGPSLAADGHGGTDLQRGALVWTNVKESGLWRETEIIERLDDRLVVMVLSRLNGEEQYNFVVIPFDLNQPQIVSWLTDPLGNTQADSLTHETMARGGALFPLKVGNFNWTIARTRYADGAWQPPRIQYCRVTDHRPHTVPAGTFMAYRIDCSDGSRRQVTWFSEQYGIHIAHTTGVVPQGKTEPVFLETEEVLAAKLTDANGKVIAVLGTPP